MTVRPGVPLPVDLRASFTGAPARVASFDPTIWRVVGDPLRAADSGGPLSGLTVAVKDLFALTGQQIGAGVPAYLRRARVERATAPAATLLLRGGAAVRGIARTDEFAYSLTGDNPHYGAAPNVALPGALPGGSSGGGASAVAAGEAEIALATDTAGSIRVPASYQGLWGLRTTHGAVARKGVLPLAPSFDTVGWLTRDGESLRRVVEWSLGSAEREKQQDELPWRFMVPAAALDDVDPATRLAFTALLRALGPAVRDVGSPRAAQWRAEEVASVFRTIQAAEAWREHGAWVRRHRQALGPTVSERFRWASAVTAEEEAAARARATVLRDDLRRLVRDDVVLLPTVPGPAPARHADERTTEGTRQATLRLTAPASIAGLPSVSVPLLTVPSPLGPAPVGVSLIGRPGSDAALVRLALRLRPLIENGTDTQ